MGPFTDLRINSPNTQHGTIIVILKESQQKKGLIVIPMRMRRLSGLDEHLSRRRSSLIMSNEGTSSKEMLLLAISASFYSDFSCEDGWVLWWISGCTHHWIKWKIRKTMQVEIWRWGGGRRRRGFQSFDECK